MNNIDVIDLFCGCGGFSEGAKQAGCDVPLAIDNWDDAIRVHSLNHPNTSHMNLTLGYDDVHELLENQILTSRVRNKRIHVHASPPCQNISIANPSRDTKKGIEMVKWTVDLLQNLGVDSWSVENVYNTKLMPLVAEHGGQLLYMEKLGLPQSRKRLFIGDVHLSIPDSPVIVGMDSVLSQTDRLPWDEYVCKNVIKNTMYKNGIKTGIPPPPLYLTRALSDPSYTITSKRAEIINTRDYTREKLTILETAMLQSFPIDYNWGDTNITNCAKMIANAVPPLVSKLIMESLI